MDLEKTDVFCFGAEDGTALKREVDYNPNTNEVTGLPAPFSKTTGMPETGFHKANTPIDVHKSVTKYFNKWVKTLYVVMLITLIRGVPPYIFVLFGTTNEFSHENCQQR